MPGSKRKVLVAKVAVKQKFQPPNWQMQKNALLVCFWSGYCFIGWLVFAIAASYSCLTVERFTLLLFNAGAFSPSSFEPSFSLTGHSRRTLVDALGHFLPSNPNWKRLMWMTEVPCKLTAKARTIFPPPHCMLRWSRKEKLREGT